MPVRRVLDIKGELLESFDHSARVTEYLVGRMPARIWRTDSPYGGRTIAAVAAHMQSVRWTFAKMGGYDGDREKIESETTPAQASRALKQSREALTTIFTGALDRGQGRVARLPRRTINMMLYLVQHDAHHRGQITMIARALGHRLEGQDVTRLWGWRKLP